ncbi:hypothetical protein Vretimale_10951 [Volvox reticuliferus]|uniref:UBC core domain-containing protein n=1 Tax=Volvox reticuliferus TaxID=1737510 RepID=A0A8J4GGI8_9CHLO|nr:hypothetical protein Vretimale_10951 [Volvox reticuliferus]
METSSKFNLRNPGVKRIIQEMKEIQEDTSGDFLAEALETDIFEWHFVIRGPRDTEFEGGIYHGRILLPAEYPFKPPSFILLTPNGRFETNMKICLTISNHHPEAWQPSWGVRTALLALIAFMPTPGNGALGALEFPKEDRRALAARSRLEAPRFGNPDRQAVIDNMHRRMLAISVATGTKLQSIAEGTKAQNSPDGTIQRPNQEENTGATVSDRQGGSEGEAQSRAGAASGDAVVPSSAEQAAASRSAGMSLTTEIAAAAEKTDVGKGNGGASGIADASWPAVTATATNGSQLHKRPRPAPQSVEQQSQAAATAAATPTAAAASTQLVAAAVGTGPTYATIAAPDAMDYALTGAMVVLGLAILFIIARKAISAVGYDISEVLQMFQMLQ